VGVRGSGGDRRWHCILLYCDHLSEYVVVCIGIYGNFQLYSCISSTPMNPHLLFPQIPNHPPPLEILPAYIPFSCLSPFIRHTRLCILSKYRSLPIHSYHISVFLKYSISVMLALFSGLS
jgi:hypothetical protein